MRTVHPDAVPIVELRAAEMPTKFGKKSRPVFKVVGWRTASAGLSAESAKPASVAKPAPAERLIAPQEVERTERQIRDREIDDEIPFN